VYAGVGRVELGAGDDRLDGALGADLIVGCDRIGTGAGPDLVRARTVIATWWAAAAVAIRAFVSGNDVVRGCERVELGSPD
jgi:hypothetical protein